MQLLISMCLWSAEIFIAASTHGLTLRSLWGSHWRSCQNIFQLCLGKHTHTTHVLPSGWSGRAETEWDCFIKLPTKACSTNGSLIVLPSYAEANFPLAHNTLMGKPTYLKGSTTNMVRGAGDASVSFWLPPLSFHLLIGNLGRLGCYTVSDPEH